MPPPCQTRLTRREVFSAAHRLHSPHLSEGENRRVYGKCNWEGGHGHNYQVEVTLAGPVDPTTGMLVNLADLKQLLWETVLSQLDHRNLDRDVPYFASHPSTAENVARYIWEQLEPVVPAPACLCEIKLCETENNHVVLRRE